MSRRWHKGHDRCYKRLWRSCQTGHTALAGLVYRGARGLSRAQTVQAWPPPSRSNPNPSPDPSPSPNPNPNLDPSPSPTPHQVLANSLALEIVVLCMQYSEAYGPIVEINLVSTFMAGLLAALVTTPTLTPSPTPSP